jgi:hypothetical protein
VSNTSPFTNKKNIFQNYISVPGGQIWTGWTDEGNEGNFYDPNDPQVFLADNEFQPWYMGEPNGDVRENCMLSWITADAKWIDLACRWEICSFCELERSPNVQIRGKPTPMKQVFCENWLIWML